MKSFKFLLSGEFLFAAFLLSSVFKSALPDMIIDINIILFGWTGLIALKRLIIKPYIYKKSILPFTIIALFLSVMALSVIYSPSEMYSIEKLLIFSSITLWSFAGPFFLIKDKDSLKSFLISFMSMSVLTSIYVLSDYFTSSHSDSLIRLGVNGTNSLGLARMSALGSIVILLLYLFNSEVGKFKKGLSIVGLATLVLVLFLTGSRMPLLSLAFAVLVFLCLKTFQFSEKDILINKNAVKVAISLVPLPLLMLPFQDNIQTMITRVGNIFNDTGFGSYTQRTDRFSLALDIFRENPLLGDGLGSYAINFNGIDERYYPHNIILEVMSELGLVGLILFVVLLIMPFFLNNVFKSNYLQVCVLLMFIYTFLNANTTGDINDNRMMFTFLALLYMYPLINDENNVIT